MATPKESPGPTAPWKRAYPEALREGEEKLRGRALKVGLALSGGGIRSATFCLGVLQALAKHNALKKVDVMSTVSGGGYAGGMLTRLLTRDGVDCAEDAGRAIRPEENAPGGGTSGSAKSTLRPGVVLRWLRENGRYLAPKGAGDLLLAATVGLRNWLSIHAALATLLLGVFLAMQVPRQFTGQIEHWQNTYLPLTDHLCWSPWLALSPPLLLLAALLAWIYWLIANRASSQMVPAQRAHRWTVRLKKVFVVLLVVLGLSAVDTLGQTLYATLSRSDSDLASRLLAGAVALISAVLSSPMVAAQFGPADDRGRARLRFRVGAGVLAVLLYGSLFIGLNALAHAAAWGFRPPDCSPDTPRPRVEQSLEAIHVELAGVRRHLESGDDSGHPGTNLRSTRPDHHAGERQAARQTWYWLVLASVVLFIICALVRRGFLNNSALLPLYTARLARAYLGASNPARTGQSRARSPVTRPIEGDDVDLDEIPHDTWKKGPLHLVNMTINETVHGTSGLQHGDRQGVGLAIGPMGLSAGVRHHVVWTNGDNRRRATVYPEAPCEFRMFEYAPADRPSDDDSEGRESNYDNEERLYGGEQLSLGQWIAISGAAFSTGMGKNTSLGLSLLASFFNIRLGYWWDSGVEPKRRSERLTSGLVSRAIRKAYPVHSHIADEAIGRFHGTARRRLWNLSDGGHFENMGAYEVLRRRLPLIVIVDAEADPEYKFAGLANLIRKARIDFGAEIRFLTESELSGKKIGGQGVRFGTLEKIRPKKSGKNSGAHAALARVSYLDDPRQQSVIVYLKAAVVGEEPADVAAYKAAHPVFPQETTADQFFDEAQWESYRKLGEFIGSRIFAGCIEELWGLKSG